MLLKLNIGMDEAVRDAFITGLQSNVICQRLLENNILDLNTMFTKARSLDAAQKSFESYSSLNHLSPTTVSPKTATALPQSTTSENASEALLQLLGC